MNDHKIVGRDDEGELAAETQGEKRPRRQFDHRDDEIVDEADPPKIPVAPTEPTEVGLGVGFRAFRDPFRRHHLPVAPGAVV